jgi:hypothetical protein
MGLRRTVGSTLESVIGPQRTQALRQTERRTRQRLAQRIAPPPARRARRQGPPPGQSQGGGRKGRAQAGGQGGGQGGAQGPGRIRRLEPFVPHPTPTMTRHELLAGLHELLAPRTYLEIGVRDGQSLRLSRARSIGVDPAFRVQQELHCDVQLVRARSDDFFARPDALAHLDGVPVDLAFIDGMHLSEYALRDLVNTEPHMARTGVVVFDDTLPRNDLEAARERCTSAWAGDVFKAAEVLRRRRPDLLVLMVNTAPTGTTVVVGLDPDSSVLKEAYDEELPYLLAGDPQQVPRDFLDRSAAVDPVALLGSPAWSRLRAARAGSDHPDLASVREELSQVPRLAGTAD